MKCKAVVFDLFGTLIDMFKPCDYEKAMLAMADAIGAPGAEFIRLWRYETWRMRDAGFFKTIEENIRYIAEVLNLSVDREAVAAAVKIRFDFMRRTLNPRPGTIQVLAGLRREGYKLGLISDCAPDIPVIWGETPFAPLIDAPVFSCSVRMCKPDKNIYRLVCEKLSVRPEECLFVGDGGSNELSGAVRAGMKAVLLRVDYEDFFDIHREDALKWKGMRISSIHGILSIPGIGYAKENAWEKHDKTRTNLKF